MIMTAETAYSILEHIATKGSVYDEIMDNIITPNYERKPELISELSIGFLNNQKSVNKALKGGYFNYYFIMAVKNQVHSSTSPFYKNVIQTGAYDIPVSEVDIIDEEDDLSYKELNERQHKVLNQTLDEIKVNWFDKEIFEMYYNDNYTYRQIEKETGIDHCLCWVTIDKIKKRIKKQIKDKDIYL